MTVAEKLRAENPPFKPLDYLESMRGYLIPAGNPLSDMNDQEFGAFCATNGDWRIERTPEGDIEIMPPAFTRTGMMNAEINLQLSRWARSNKNGLVFDSSAGFKLEKKAIRAPDFSWVSKERASNLSEEQKKGFWALCPDFVGELRSESDSMDELRTKMREYMRNGAKLGWLIDPIAKEIYVYQAGSPEPQLIKHPKTITGDPVLPGFVLTLAEIWG